MSVHSEMEAVSVTRIVVVTTAMLNAPTLQAPSVAVALEVILWTLILSFALVGAKIIVRTFFTSFDPCNNYFVWHVFWYWCFLSFKHCGANFFPLFFQLCNILCGMSFWYLEF